MVGPPAPGGGGSSTCTGRRLTQLAKEQGHTAAADGQGVGERGLDDLPVAGPQRDGSLWRERDQGLAARQPRISLSFAAPRGPRGPKDPRWDRPGQAVRPEGKATPSRCRLSMPQRKLRASDLGQGRGLGGQKKQSIRTTPSSTESSCTGQTGRETQLDTATRTGTDQGGQTDKRMSTLRQAHPEGERTEQPVAAR